MPMSDPFRPIRFVLLALTVVGLIGGCSLDDLLPPGRDDPPPPDAPQATSPHPVAVERVEVQVLESFPVQVQAVVHGSLRDACTEIGAVRQVRSPAPGGLAAPSATAYAVKHASFAGSRACRPGALRL